MVSSIGNKNQILQNNTRFEQVMGVLNDNAIVFEPDILQPIELFQNLSGEAMVQQLFITQNDQMQEFCLRPDFTLPIAKHHADLNGSEPQIYSYCGHIFRQKPDGKEEFLQAGFEMLGFAENDKVPAKVFGKISAVLDAYSFSSLTLRLGDVALFEAVLEQLGFPKAWQNRLRSRFGDQRAFQSLLKALETPTTQSFNSDLDAVRAEVEQAYLDGGMSFFEGRSVDDVITRYAQKLKESQTPIEAKKIELLKEYLSFQGDVKTVLAKLTKFEQKAGIDLTKQIETLGKFINELDQKRYSRVVFATSYGRRMTYYSGLIFDIYTKDQEQKPLIGGGQYDRLIPQINLEKNCSAFGAAFWLERFERFCEADK